MSTPPGPTTRSEIELLLTGEAVSSPDTVLALAKLAHPESIDLVRNVVRKAVVEEEWSRADTMLSVFEHAARLAGEEEVRYWSRICRGILAARQENVPRARTLFQPAFDALNERGLIKNIDLRHAYLEMGDWLSGQALAAKNAALAREILARMFALTGGADSVQLQAGVLVKLLWLALTIKDIASTEAHALHLIKEGLWKAAWIDDNARRDVFNVVQRAAFCLYEAGEERYDAAQQVARAVVSEEESGPLLLLLSNIALGQTDFSGALGYLNRLLEAPSQLLPGYGEHLLQHRKAMCLTNLGRNAEAIATISVAVRIAPCDPYVRYGAGEIYGYTDRVDQAIKEYTEVIRLSSARIAEETAHPASDTKPRSMGEYLSNLPITDLRDFAMQQRALFLQAEGRIQEATEQLTRISHTHYDGCIIASASIAISN